MNVRGPSLVLLVGLQVQCASVASYHTVSRSFQWINPNLCRNQVAIQAHDVEGRSGWWRKVGGGRIFDRWIEAPSGFSTYVSHTFAAGKEDHREIACAIAENLRRWWWIHFLASIVLETTTLELLPKFSSLQNHRHLPRIFTLSPDSWPSISNSWQRSRPAI